MKERSIPVFILPRRLRKLLSMPQGTLYVSDGIVRDLWVDYAVGDMVSVTLRYNTNVIDYKTRRREKLKPPVNKPSTRIINPPGTLSINSKTMFKARGYRTFIVYGEEDLVPLAISLEREHESIGYGQPGVGVVVLRTNIIRARRLLKTFKPSLYFLIGRSSVVE